jgi:O-antigen/teichoic acid export membrane protein
MQVVQSSESGLPAARPGSRFSTYLTVLAVGSLARMFGLASQFVVLIILGRMLSKDSFGDLMTAFGFYRLAAAALGVGASLVLLYHVSRRPNDRTAEIRLHRYSAMLCGAVASLVGVAGFNLASPVAHAIGKPELAVWLRQLAPFVIFSTLLITSTGPLEGRSRISESIALADVGPNTVRIVLLPAVAWFGLPEEYVAHAMTLSVLIPWLWSGRGLWNSSVRGWQPWTGWDLNYCGKFVAATLFANQLGAVDILVAGVLFPSETVADYALAARIAGLYSFFQLALLKRFSPGAARMIEANDLAALRKEFAFCRKLTIGCGALTIVGILSTAPFLLPLFGKYAGAWPFLFWLAIPTFVKSFYDTSDRLLIIAGQPNVPLLLTTASFCILTTTPFVTAPLIGPTAIPAAMIASALLFNPLAAARVRRVFAIATIHARELLLMGVGLFALASSAATGVAVAAVASIAVLAAIAIYYCVSAIRPIGA